MKLYRKKFFDNKTIILIFFLFIISVISVLTKIDRNFKAEIINFLEGQNLGFSSLTNLKKENEIYKGIKIPFYFLRSAKDIFLFKINNRNEYEKLNIDIKFENFLKILNDKKMAEKYGYLINREFTDATINYKGKKYKANIRLKGSVIGHLDGHRRLSFRVKLKNDKSILGFKTFSIHRPSARQFPYDYIFSLINRDIGNLSPIHKFAKIAVNGQEWGIMHIEEHFESSFLEKQKRKDGIVLSLGKDDKEELIIKLSRNTRQNNNLILKKDDKSNQIQNHLLIKQIRSWYKLSKNTYGPNIFNQKKYLKDENNRIIYTYIVNEILKKNNKIFDQNSLIKSIILSSIWGNYHSIIDINSRFYFNPYTLKLEFIPTDQAQIYKISSLTDAQHLEHFIEESLNYLDDFNEEKFSKNFHEINKLNRNYNKFFLQAKKIFPVDQEINEKILNQNSSSVTFKNIQSLKKYDLNKVPLDISIFRNNSAVFLKHIYFNHFSNGVIEIYNLLPDNVILKKILYNENKLNLEEIILPSYLKKQEPKIIKTNFFGYLDEKIIIETEYNGTNKTQKNELTLVSKKYFNPLDEEKKECNSCFQKKGKNYLFKTGDWVINDLLVFKGNLEIKAGTKIKFGKKAGLIVNGALKINGDLNQPVIMESLNDSWQGIYVYNANDKSYLKNVIFKNLAGINQSLLKLTGSINFYNSDLLISNVKITNNISEDAINIVNSQFKIDKLNIENSISDAIDFDFSDGSISESNFSKINGDAIDISGSTILIKKVLINNVKDKAVSVGEKSSVKIYKSKFYNTGVGVASKDGSNVEIDNSIFSNYSLYSVMSYNKKDFYGPSRLIVTNSKFGKKRLSINQKNNFMMIDNEKIKQSYLNVKDLYQNSIMKK